MFLNDEEDRLVLATPCATIWGNPDNLKLAFVYSRFILRLHRHSTPSSHLEPEREPLIHLNDCIASKHSKMLFDEQPADVLPLPFSPSTTLTTPPAHPRMRRQLLSRLRPRRTNPHHRLPLRASICPHDAPHRPKYLPQASTTPAPQPTATARLGYAEI